MELSEPVQFILGLPSMSAFAIGLVGLPVQFPTKEIEDAKEKALQETTSSVPKEPLIEGTDLTLSELDRFFELDLNKDENSLYSSYLAQYQKLLMIKIQSLLEANSQLVGFCKLPNSQISFETGDKAPSFRRQYRIPHKMEEVITEQVKTWYEAGTIVKSLQNSPWNSSVLIVPKRDLGGHIKGWRVCIDPRHINMMIPDANFPLPIIREVIEDLSGSRIYSKIDLKQGFNQLLVKEEDRVKTAFTWKNQQYKFVGAPFGFKNIPSSFQMIISSYFADLPFVRVYVDDIIIFSQSLTLHVEHVATVIKRLTKANLRTQAAKCTFGVTKIQALGYEISPEGFRVAPEKLVAIEGWTYPLTGKQLEKHLGFFNFFRSVIPLYSRLTAPLDKLRKVKDLKPVWTPDHTRAYDNVRKALHSAVILKFPDFQKPFQVGTDASDRGLGAVLYQEMGDQTIAYISFAARSLSTGECNYGATKRELAAIIFALRKFRYYLWGTHFTLHTDHKALTYLFTQRHLNPMINNWLEELLDFNFSIVHRPGVLNVLPDRLSRLFDADPRTGPMELPTNLNLGIPQTVEIESFDSNGHNEVPPELRTTLMERAHIAGHFGSTAITKSLIMDNKSWPGIHADVKQHVAQCLPCQRYNIGKHGFHPLKAINAKLPFDHIAIDLKQLPTSKNGYNYILVVVDVCTRFVFLRELRNKEANNIAKALLKIFCDVGFPKILQSDNGSEFVNSLLKEIITISKIDHRLIAEYHARANGLAERFVQTISQVILKILNGVLEEWDLHVRPTQLYTNTKISTIHNSKPFSLMFARPFNGFTDNRNAASELLTPDEILSRAEYLHKLVYPAVNGKTAAEQTKAIKAFNSKHKRRIIDEDHFIPGAFVMVRDEIRNDKTSPRYAGPFEIVRRNRGGTYLLKGPGNTQYKRPPNVLKLVTYNQGTTDWDQHCEVDRIVDHRPQHIACNDNTEYRTRWKGLADTEDTWEKATAFDDPSTIHKYLKSVAPVKRSSNNRPGVRKRQRASRNS
jgi:transposase InsO family protein